MNEDKKISPGIRIEKVVLSCAGVGDKLERSVQLLNMITGRKPKKTKSKKRIPTFGIRPGLEIGCMVTLRGKQAISVLLRLLEAVDNKIKFKQVVENGFSFGIAEYIEIPGTEYVREIGILGLSVTVVFSRKGKRTAIKKNKRGKIPSRQYVTRQEIIDYIKQNFKTELVGREK